MRDADLDRLQRGMTIQYDPGRQRATHVESGVAVEFDRAGHNAQERDIYFRLIWKGRELPFQASYDFGEGKIERLYPELGITEQREKRLALNEVNYYVRRVPLNPTAAMPDFPEVFVALLYEVVSHFDASSRKAVHYLPFSSPLRWSMEG
jgi:hypothetical protein